MTRRRTRWLLHVVLPVLAAGPLAAQQSDTPPLVAVGDRTLDLSRLREGTDTSRVVWTRQGRETAGPLQIEEVRFVEAGGRPMVLHRMTVQGPAFTMTDTTWLARGDLAPIRHRSHAPQRTLLLDYEAGAVRGSVAPKDSATRRVGAALALPVFDPSSLHLVLRSLPLAEGYAARLPFFDHERLTDRITTVRVTGSEAVGVAGRPGAQAWVVEVDTGAHEATYWVDRETGDPVRVVSRPAPGVELRVLPGGGA